MELPNIAAYAYQDVHVWSALLTCLRPTQPPSLSPPSRKARGAKPPPPPRKEAEAVRVGLGRRVRQPRLFLLVVLRRRHPPPPPNKTPPPKSKAVPATKEKGREKKAEGGGKEPGGGGVKKEDGGGPAIRSWEPPPTSRTGAG